MGTFLREYLAGRALVKFDQSKTMVEQSIFAAKTAAYMKPNWLKLLYLLIARVDALL